MLLRRICAPASLEVAVRQPLHRALRADRHERRRLDVAVRRRHHAAACGAIGVGDAKSESWALTSAKQVYNRAMRRGLRRRRTRAIGSTQRSGLRRCRGLPGSSRGAAAGSPAARSSPPSTTPSSRPDSTRRGRRWPSDLPAGAARSLPGARRRGAVVGDAARSRQPQRSTRASSRRPAAAIAAAEAWTKREPGARRSVVLPRRRLRAAGAVAGSARPAARGRARRQCNQGRARAGARPRPRPARCLLRHRPVSLLRRRRAGGAEGAALAAVPARRRSRAGPARNAAGARPRRAAARRSRLPAALAVSLVRAASGAGRSTLLRDLDRAVPVQSALSPAHRRSAARIFSRSCRQRRHFAHCSIVQPADGSSSHR